MTKPSPVAENGRVGDGTGDDAFTTETSGSDGSGSGSSGSGSSGSGSDD